MTEQHYFVSTGISGGNPANRKWATYERKPNGSLRRVKSKYLPLRATKEEAEEDLAEWLHSADDDREACEA